MVELSRQLPGEKIVIAGYRDDKLFLKEELERNAVFYAATEDGSVGTKGNVLDAIRENKLTADVIYACGPTPMLRALKAYAQEQDIECWISMEERMACGIGACLACVCQSKRWTIILMYITNVSAKTDRYFWQRRWNCEYKDKYKRKYCRS